MSEPDKDTFKSFSQRKLTLTTFGGRRFMVDAGDVPTVICWPPTEQLEIEADEESPGMFIIRRVSLVPDAVPHEEIRASEL